MKKMILITLLMLLSIGAYVFRVIQVNENYPELKVVKFACEDTATYGGQNSSGGMVAEGDVNIVVRDFSSLDYEELLDLEYNYRDFLMENHTAKEMRCLMVFATATNSSNKPINVHFRDFKLESGAWSNGINPMLFEAINDDAADITRLDPGEGIDVYLPFCIYDVQFSDREKWESSTTSEYGLALSLYPTKYLIELETPKAQG